VEDAPVAIDDVSVFPHAGPILSSRLEPCNTPGVRSRSFLRQAPVEDVVGPRRVVTVRTTISRPRSAKLEKSSSLKVNRATSRSLNAHSAMTASWVRPPTIFSRGPTQQSAVQMRIQRDEAPALVKLTSMSGGRRPRRVDTVEAGG